MSARYGTIRLVCAGAMLALLCSCLCSCTSSEGLRDLYARVSPSVAVIHTVERMPSPQTEGQFVKTSSLGSGVLISDDGKMLTAAHVVQSADKLIVRFPGGDKVGARVISSVPSADIALLQLDKKPLGARPVSLGDSDRVRIGDPVCVIGSPYGIEYVLSAGYISARIRPRSTVRGFELGEYFQTDAAINKGNSGGPIFNMKGEVIGIVSSVLSQSGGFEGIGFAVTSNMASRLTLEEKLPWSGFEGRFLTGEFAAAFHLARPEGYLIERVAENSPADRAGLRGGSILVEIEGHPVLVGGDIILSVQGIPLDTQGDSLVKIREALRGIRAGDEIKFLIRRGGEEKEITVLQTR